jgi:nucleotide-binding universal stress UspA family protein
MKTIKRILVALDGSKSALQATNYAIDFAHLVNAKIEIISIIKYAMGNIDAGVLPSEVEKANELRTIKLIEKIKKEHPNTIIKDFVTVGIPVKEIHKGIKEWKADLLIIGHQTHSFVERLYINSVEKKLINHIECPILIIPESINN